MPVSPPPVLVHNDFYLHNVMVGAVNHGEIVGVFDWEMSTIGDPLVDLGIVMNYWRDKNDPPELLGDLAGRSAHAAPRLPDPRRTAAAIRDPHRPRRKRDAVLLGLGALENRDGRRANLRPLRPRPNH